MNNSGESEILQNSTMGVLRERVNISIFKLSKSFDEDEDYIFDKPHVRIILVTFYTTVFCLCFFGNLAVVLVVTLHWKMRSITKFCLGNLAFANLCVAIFCIFQNLSTFLIDRWVFGHFMCKMYHFVNSLSHTASTLILVVICVERYLAILHPFKTREWITLTRLKVVIVTVWLASAALCSPRLHYITTYNIPVSTKASGSVKYDVICAPQQSLYNAHVVDMVYFIVLFLLPLMVISILYSRIGIHLWRGKAMMRQLISLPNHPTLNCNCQNKNTNNSVNNSTYLESDSNSGGSSCRTNPLAEPNFNQRFPSISDDAETSERSGSDLLRSPAGQQASGCLEGNAIREIGLRENASLSLKDDLNENVSGAKLTFPVTFQVENGSSKGLDNNQQQDRSPRLLKGNCNDKPLTCSNLPGIIPISAKDKEKSRSSVCSLHASSKDRVLSSILLKRILKPRNAVIKMLIVIVVTFAICNLPFHIRKLCVNYLASYDFGSDFSNLFAPFTFLLMYANCAINPIIFAFMSKDFQSSLVDLAKCRLKRPSGNGNNFSVL